jgi:hypothetical protein
MAVNLDIDEMMNRFRLASRTLFNQFFRVSRPYENEGWIVEQRFSEVQALLFEKLVTEPASLPNVKYGFPQPEITVRLRNRTAPIMLNRERSSGYWDYPLKEINDEARLIFIRFFDWDQLDYRDHRYVVVEVQDWPAHPEVVGKQGLLESHHARFGERSAPA